MTSILSQHEIDNLLRDLQGSGNLDAESMKNDKKTVKSFDFRTINKFAREQIKTLQSIFETFSQQFSTYLSVNLRTPCSIELMTVEELRYSEYVNAQLQDNVLIELSMMPLRGSAIMEISAHICHEMINCLLGGRSTSKHDNRVFHKNFTEIELALISKITYQMRHIIDDAWSKVVAIESRFEKIETSSQFIQIIAYNETVALITLEIKVGELEGVINFCIPYLMLEPILKELNTRFIFETRRKSDDDLDYKPVLKKELNKVKVPMHIKFNSTPITVGEVLELQVGDVVQLNHGINDDMRIDVDNIPKFYGQLGESNKRYAIKVTTVIKEEDEVDEDGDTNSLSNGGN